MLMYHGVNPDLLSRPGPALGQDQMGDTCRLPSGEKPFSFGLGPKTLAFVVMPLVACTPLMLYLFIPWFGTVLGMYLRRKTEGRRAQVVEAVKKEEAAFQAKSKGQKESDDEWESIDAAVAAAANGEKGQKEWDGVVGFFHPFW